MSDRQDLPEPGGSSAGGRAAPRGAAPDITSTVGPAVTSTVVAAVVPCRRSATRRTSGRRVSIPPGPPSTSPPGDAGAPSGALSALPRSSVRPLAVHTVPTELSATSDKEQLS